MLSYTSFLPEFTRLCCVSAAGRCSSELDRHWTVYWVSHGTLQASRNVCAHQDFQLRGLSSFELVLLVDTSKNRYSSVIRGRIGMKFGRYTRGMYTHRRSEPDFRFIVSKFLNWLISNQHKFRLISLFLVKSGWNFAVIYYGRTQINAVSRICDLVWASWLISNL